MEGIELRLHLLLNSTLGGGGWKAALPDRFYYRRKSLLYALNGKLYEPENRYWRLRELNFENVIGSGTTCLTP